MVLIPSLFEDHFVEAYLYRPIASCVGRPAILHMHGGGYTAGHPFMSDSSNRQLAHDHDCLVLSVNYRKAPDVPHPGPVEDCYSALAWLRTNADMLGVDPAKLAVKGGSSGGGLAASLTLMNRDRGEISLIFQMLTYPMLDDRTGAVGGHNPITGEFIWTPESNRFGWASLLGRAPGGADVPYTASPARAPDLSGLPPAFIVVGQLDLFVDEDIAYAQRLIRDGVPVELYVYPGAYHGFDNVPGSEVATACIDAGQAALRRVFARAGWQPREM